MASTGNCLVQLGLTLPAGDNHSWCCPYRISSSYSGSYTSYCDISKQDYSDFIVGSNPAFPALPDLFRVDGISASIVLNAQSSTVRDVSVRLTMSGIPISGSINMASNSGWPGDRVSRIYGGSDNCWGCVLDKQAVESPAFGIRLQAYNSSTDEKRAFVGRMYVNLYYTELPRASVRYFV